jgi:hypothetical protein
MDKTTLYLETSVISYLAARPSRDPITARNQRITREWWDTRRRVYDLRTSDIVLTEARRGDAHWAGRRIALLTGIPVLPIDDARVGKLAADLLREVPLPAGAMTDALHIAAASLSGMEYLLTWNCKHIANPRLHSRMRRVITVAGSTPPVLCTPAELMAEA